MIVAVAVGHFVSFFGADFAGIFGTLQLSEASLDNVHIAIELGFCSELFFTEVGFKVFFGALTVNVVNTVLDETSPLLGDVDVAIIVRLF